ncbi:hypothetical protein SAMN05443144_109151 [Fodinibius roseus]|uniref:DinB superfamily protein n=1 Tax=Fodinibius roseus TaxID=1194090 RepID=A0A1M5C9Q1_9BACT|nr:hypothetical protein [Fodinibius roseus]SHF51458.1 hypothetical protein SAMN05443144_109151 [Fodinibius roseus]
MADQKVSREEVTRLIEDAAYLQDEADALQYVIESVPYDQSPPGKRSIGEILLLIDHAQTSYYRSILEDALNSERPTHVDKFAHFEESFDFDGEIEDIQKVLKKISKHRAGVVNAMKNIPLIDWETTIYNDNQQLLLVHLMQQMIRFERGMLKNIASQVMEYSKEKETKREIQQRQQRQQKNGEDPVNNT